MNDDRVIWIMSLCTGLFFFVSTFSLIRSLIDVGITVLFTLLLCVIPLWMPKKMLEVNE